MTVCEELTVGARSPVEGAANEGCMRAEAVCTSKSRPGAAPARRNKDHAVPNHAIVFL